MPVPGSMLKIIRCYECPLPIVEDAGCLTRLQLAIASAFSIPLLTSLTSRLFILHSYCIPYIAALDSS